MGGGLGLYLNWWVLCLDAQSPGFNAQLGPQYLDGGTGG